MTARNVLTRLRLSLVACVVLVGAAAALTGSAVAAPPGSGIPANQAVHNPYDTNVPLLAWRGEQMKLVKCDSQIGAGTVVLPNYPTGGTPSNARANFYVEDFSAPNNADGSHPPWPEPVTGTFRVVPGIGTNAGLNCITGDFMSMKAGLAQIKLIVTDTSNTKVLEHQFLVGWMGINSAVMRNAGSVTDLPGAEPGNAAIVQVTGSIPINSEFQTDWGLPASLVMPTDWARLAESGIASTSRALRQQYPATSPSQYWDIHDSSGPPAVNGDGGLPDIHVPGYCGGTSTTIDQVDNCARLLFGEFGRFSRIFGDGSGDIADQGGGFRTLGPFDPGVPGTLLSDGKLNAADAPMPALRVDFSNSGPFGFFTNSSLSDKHVVYSRDGLGSNTAHNLYAPYYGAYIPGAQRNLGIHPGPYSGSNGPHFQVGTPGNNFEGYLNHGQYHYWDIADVVVNAVNGPSPCRLLDPREGQPIFRPLNSGPQVAAYYTDEHGEVRATWRPGLGNDNYGTTVGFVDQNGGCDLEGVNLGTSTISALARYPFQQVANPTAVAGTIAKSLLNRFRKDVVCVRKDNVSSAVAYICTATARDITGGGAVFNGERVCFGREPENVWYDVGGYTPHPNGYCVYLSGGTATAPATVSVETDATLLGTFVDVAARFVDEHLIRDTCIVSGQPISTPGPCGSVGGTTTGGTTTGGTTTGGTTTGGTTTGGTTTGGTTTGGSNSNITLLTGPKVPAVTKAKARASVASVQLVATKSGRVLKVRIVSAKKTAKIQIRLINAKGRVIAIVTRTVKTNKLVLVPNLRVAKNVKSVRVKVLS